MADTTGDEVEVTAIPEVLNQGLTRQAYTFRLGAMALKIIGR